MADALGCATCRFCGARYTLWTITNRSMQGLCNGWKKRHEHGCKDKTPSQRRGWARKYVGKDHFESSIEVNLKHPGFLDVKELQEGICE